MEALDDAIAEGCTEVWELAERFGTPAYLIDENTVRENCREYLRAATAEFGADALPLYASKALCFTGMYKIAAQEGLGIDCVSGGELYTAKKAGFPAEKIYFHGNNKTDADIEYAIEKGVGYFVVDNAEELNSIEKIAIEKRKNYIEKNHTRLIFFFSFKRV